MSSTVNEIYKTINKTIDLFLEDAIHEFKLKLNVVVDEKEFNDLIGNPDSTNGVVNGVINIDEYVYAFNENVDKKIFIEYIKQPGNKYAILSIEGINEFIR